MTYEELKQFDLLTIKSQEDLDNYKVKIFESEADDVLKYINFLRYTQYHTNISYKYIQYIMKLLAEDELCSLEREHNTILNGEVEDLALTVSIDSIMENPITITAPNFVLKGSLRAMLEENFEKVIVVQLSPDNELKNTLMLYGYIIHNSIDYVYELPEKNQEYIQLILEAEIGTRVNIRSYHMNEEILHKTFTKVEFKPEWYENFTLTRKTPQGILSPSVSGTYNVLKSEKLISSESLFKDEIAKIREDLQKKYDFVLDKIKKQYDDAMKEFAKGAKDATDVMCGGKKEKKNFHDSIMDAFSFDPDAEEEKPSDKFPKIADVKLEVEPTEKDLCNESPHPGERCCGGGCHDDSCDSDCNDEDDLKTLSNTIQ